MNVYHKTARIGITFVLAVVVAGQLSANVTADLKAENETTHRLNVALVGKVFDEALLESESIDHVVEDFTEAANAPENSPLTRAKSLLTIAHFHWKFGRTESALEAIDNALDIHQTTDSTLLKARILDASGDEEEAVRWYQMAEQTTEVAEERELIRIRLAMINIDNENVAALIELAKTRGQTFKNQAAITLAVLGHPDRALELYVPDPNDSKYYQQLVRVAEWALTAGDLKTAQQLAWQAHDSTKFRLDSLYALALVHEAYRRNQQLDELITELEGRGDENPDLLHLRIDLLIDTERFEDAIALYRAMGHDASDIEARARLIQLYETAGQTDSMIDEYESLIQSEPAVVEWYSGLATHYVNIAEPENAEEIWDRFERNNANSIAVLVRGGDFMKQMGFVNRAIDMVTRHAEENGPSLFGQMFLFETHLARGQDADAREAMQKLEASLPADSSGLRTVADSYERLHDHEQALNVYLAIEEHQGKLSYDDSMRLAWLHNVVGNKEESLVLWQEIWVEQESPARRSFAEGQFLLIAAELNKLADVVVDLETKLYQRTANKNDVNLLVRIYTEVGDSFSATEIVEEYAEYAEVSETEKLRQIGLVYLQLNEYGKYDAVLKRLEQIDPENRIEHIQNIVLNMLAFDLAEESNARYDEIQYWLKELREYDAEAVSGEFEASVLSLGGFQTEAIESYRRALIEQPTHSDNLLLMADLMKESDRTDEAVSLLQYVAEHAQNDNEFVVAVDGIINMIGQRRFGEELTAELKATFRWTHRVILERITAREDKFYLYTLLSEIAQETNDTEGEFRAIENSISQSGVRRPAVLRELVTMTTPNAGFFTLEQNTGDPERQLIYGRRLIGLRQQLPPDVYISIARTLLDQEDTLGAEKSLDLVRDITGQVDVTKTKANLFLDAGYTKQALGHYSQALSVNRDSLDLLTRTAALREANGQTEVANALYTQAMFNVLRSLPGTLQADVKRQDTQPQVFNPRAVDTSVNRDYRSYFEILMQAVVATWPKDEAISNIRLKDFQELFDQELASVEESWANAERLPLSRYSRLDHLADFVRRLCFSVGCTSEAEKLDIQLVKLFPDDEDLSEKLHESYRVSGIESPRGVGEESKPTTPSDARSVFEAAMVRAIEEEEVEFLVRVASLQGDSQQLVQFFRDLVREGNYLRGLRYAEVALGEADYTRLINSLASELTNNPEELIKFLNADPNYAVELEKKLGRPLIAPDELIELLGRTIETPDPSNPFRQGLTNVWQYLKQQANLDSQLTFLEAEITKLDRNPDQYFSSYLVRNIQKELMSKELTGEQRNRLADATLSYLTTIDFQDEFRSRDAEELILNFEAHPSNQELIQRFGSRFQQLSRSTRDLSSVMVEFFNGNRQSVYENLVSTAQDSDYSHPIERAILDHFLDEFLKNLETVLSGEVTDIERCIHLLNIASQVHGFSSQMFFDFRKRDLWEAVVRRFPDNPKARLHLIEVMLLENDFSQLEDQLAAYYTLDPSDQNIRVALYLHRLEYEKFVGALEVATDGGPDLRDDVVLDEILKENDELRGFFGANSGVILKRIRGQQPGFASSSLDHLSRTVSRSVENLRKQATRVEPDTEEIIAQLRTLWRGVQVSSLDQRYPLPPGYAENLLLSLTVQEDKPSPMYFGSSPFGPKLNETSFQAVVEYANTASPQNLLEAVAALSPLGEELESYLVAYDPQQRRIGVSLYPLITTTYMVHPESRERRLSELGEKLIDGIIDDHELTLWAVLKSSFDATFTRQETSAFFNEFKQLDQLTDLQLYEFAQLLAKFDQVEEAVDHYILLASRLAKYNELGQSTNFYTGTPTEPVANLLELIKDAHQRLPRSSVESLVDQIVRLAKPLGNEPEVKRVYAAFVLDAIDSVYEPDQALAIASELVPSSTEEVDVVQAYDTLRLARLVQLKREQGDFAGALAIVKSNLTRDSIDASSSLDEREDAEPDSPIQIPFSITGQLGTLAAIWGVAFPANTDPYVPTGVVPSPEILVGVRNHILGEDENWSVQLGASLIDWLDDPEIDTAAAIEFLCVMAYEHQTRGRTAEAETVVRDLEEWVGRNVAITPSRSLADFTTLLVLLDIAVVPELADKLYGLNVLNTEQQTVLLQALQNRFDPGELLTIARTADAEFPGLSVLREIRTIAETAGEIEYTLELDDRIRELEEAKIAIEQSVL